MRECGVAVVGGCRKILRLTFRARVVVVGGGNLLRASTHEWEGGSWQERPPTRISSERGGGGGRESPPSLKSREGVGRKGLRLAFRVREEVVVGEKTPVSHFERGREVEAGTNPFRHLDCEWIGGWQAKPPTRISSEGGGCA